MTPGGIGFKKKEKENSTKRRISEWFNRSLCGSIFKYQISLGRSATSVWYSYKFDFC